MFTTHKERAAGHPIVLFVLATLLGLYCSLSFGADVDQDQSPVPGPLPSDVDCIARPIRLSHPIIESLRSALAAHESGRLRDALRHWGEIDTQGAGQGWKLVSQGAAHLYLGELDGAAVALEEAVTVAPENAVVHYFLGLLQRERAARIAAPGPSAAANEVRLAFVPSEESRPRLLPQLPEERLREAGAELELAIRHSAEIDPAEPVMQFTGNQPAAPSVGELLVALHADNFVGKAHGLLAHRCLDEGLPEAAESHVDLAHRHGIPVPSGYRLIGRMYESQGRDGDAFRAYQKAALNGDGLANPGGTDEEDMRRIFEKIL